MPLPVLWTWRRLLQLAGLASIGVVQVAAALVVAVAGSRLLTTEGDQSFHSWLVPGIVVATLLLVSARVLQRRFAEALALGYIAELRVAFMSHIVRMPAGSKHIRTGLVMTRVLNDMSAIKLWLANGLVAVVVAAAVLLSITTMLVWYMPGMALTLAVAIFVWCIPVAICLRPLDRRIRDSRRKRGRIAAHAGTILATRLTLLGFGRHGPAMRGLSHLSRKLNAALVGRASLSGLLRSSGDLVFPAVALMVSVGSATWAGHTLDAVSLGVLVMMTGLISTHLSAVALGLEYRHAHRIALARLETIMKQVTIDPDAGKRVSKRKGARGLCIDRLPIGPVGRLVSLDVEPGEAVSLTGLCEDAALDIALKVARLRIADAGRITIDGHDADATRARSWWREVSVISPQLSLVRASVKDNAVLGANSPADEKEYRRILERFGLTSELEALAVGEDGSLELVPPCAVRAARAVLRHSGLVLIADRELTADDRLFEALVDELRAIDATIVVAGNISMRWHDRFRIVDLGSPLGRWPDSCASYPN
ncbi:MAG: ABC transporter ATP-binding protein [Hyphomicrobiales bacterium]|nr:ABC transporter ATP-binding protein [Hyphomicrobiales bacterium]MCP4998519.1 ABC transporter ATP-binding protein [Hyphomicrobiales bacterium]